MPPMICMAWLMICQDASVANFLASDTRRRARPGGGGTGGGFDQGTGSVEEGDAVGHLEADPLEGADFLAEGLAAVAVAGSDLQGRAGSPHDASRAGHPLRDHHLVEHQGCAVLP